VKDYISAFGTLCVFSMASACAPGPLPAARAAGIEQKQCDTSSTEQEALVRSTKVLSVAPLYSHIMNVGSAYERVDGVKLVVRPLPGVSAERMTRILQCHSARILLGQVQREAIHSDPYWLPDRWVNIEVSSENGNFAVALRADSVHDNLQVLSHANEYANNHMVASESELP
jgi:hypothetical protein